MYVHTNRRSRLTAVTRGKQKNNIDTEDRGRTVQDDDITDYYTPLAKCNVYWAVTDRFENTSAATP